MKPTFAQLEKGLKLNFVKIPAKMLEEFQLCTFVIEDFKSIEDFKNSIGKKIIIISKDRKIKKVFFEIDGAERSMYWSYLRQCIETPDNTKLKNLSKNISDVNFIDDKLKYKVNGLSAEMILKEIKNESDCFCKKLDFLFQFKNENKKKMPMTTKAINQLKADSQFKEFVMNKIKEYVNNHYVPDRVYDDTKKFHFDLNIYFFGGNLSLDNNIYNSDSKEKVISDFEALVDKFLTQKACQTNMEKVESLFIQRS